MEAPSHAGYWTGGNCALVPGIVETIAATEGSVVLIIIAAFLATTLFNCAGTALPTQPKDSGYPEYA